MPSYLLPLYTPCVAAIASVKRELGGKWAAGVVIRTMCDRLDCGIFGKNRRRFDRILRKMTIFHFVKNNIDYWSFWVYTIVRKEMNLRR